MLTTLKRLLRFWAPHRGLGVGLAVAMVLRAVFTLLLALAIKFVIDQVIEPSASTPGWTVAVVLLGGLCVSFVAGLVAARLKAKASAEIIADVRLEVFDHVQKLPMRFHDTASTGDLIAHFSSDIAQLSRGVIAQPLIGLRAIAAMALYIPAMFLLDAKLAAVATLLIPVVVYVVYRWAPPSAEALDAEKRRIADVLDEVSANLGAQRLLRAFALDGRARARFQKKIADLRTASNAAERRIAVEMVVAEYAVEVVKVLIIVVGAVLAFSGTLDAGSFAAFTAILTEFAYQASVIGMDVLPSIKQSEAGIRRIDALLAAPIAARPSGVSPAPDMASEIALDSVVLRYNDTDATPQLDGVSMTFPPASYVAIVGSNGSGKSSVLNVLLGMYELEAGRVTVGDMDVVSVDAVDMRRRIGTAFQETFLFDATIRENVAIANTGCTDDELIRALQESGLAEVVNRLPNGIDTRIGTGGVRLSGGEAQRIGIARALLREPQLLLLDEIASGLDPSTEAAVFSTVEELRLNRTIISVTHRLENVKTADRIFVLEGGRIVEVGTFEQMMSSQGTFNAMWTKQHGFDVSANGLSARVKPDRLGAIPLFSTLPEPVLADLAATFHTETYGRGEVIFEQGEPGDSFYVIARGLVAVERDPGTGTGEVVATLEDGDFFGEMALLTLERRNATVRSIAATTLLRLDRLSFAQFLSTSPAARKAIQEVSDSRAAENARSAAADVPSPSL